jgi:hypothetical protein
MDMCRAAIAVYDGTEDQAVADWDARRCACSTTEPSGTLRAGVVSAESDAAATMPGFRECQGACVGNPGFLPSCEFFSRKTDGVSALENLGLR